MSANEKAGPSPTCSSQGSALPLYGQALRAGRPRVPAAHVDDRPRAQERRDAGEEAREDFAEQRSMTRSRT
jgi:hypothetical protein